MSRDDRNIALIIAIVLLISIVALISIGSSLWRVIGPGVEEGAQTLGIFVASNTTNYNFSVPGQTQINQEVSEADAPAEAKPDTNQEETQNQYLDYNYNFLVSKSTSEAELVIDPRTYNIPDDLITDFNLESYDPEKGNVDRITVSIPVISLEAKVQTGVSIDAALQNGFAYHPDSYEFGKGEIILGCYRRYIHPSQPDSCWYISNVSMGDEITLDVNGQKVIYQIVATRVYNPSANIYQASEDSKYLKIITAHPLDSLQNRFVILAERVN